MIATPSKYDKQASDFLKKYRITLAVTTTGKNICPPFCDGKHIHGLKYTITLVNRQDRSISFPFWNSLNDRNNGKTPSAYDVLACISADAFCPDTFEDFCAEYGYDADSRTALRTFKNCADFADRLRDFFTDEQLSELSEIS